MAAAGTIAGGPGLQAADGNAARRSGMEVRTRLSAGTKKHPVKTRVLAISKIIDGRVGIVAAGHGVLRQQTGDRIRTLHGEYLAHQRTLACTRYISLQRLHGGYFSTWERSAQQLHKES